MDTRISLLAELEKSGFAAAQDISEFMKLHFKKPVEGVWGWEEVPPLAKSFLIEMNSADYIDIKLADIEAVVQPPRIIVNTSEEHWFDKPLYARIKIPGLNYLHSYRLNQSIFAANETAEKNYQAQKEASRQIYHIALLTAFITFLTLVGTIIQLLITRSDKIDKKQLSEQVNTTQLKQNQLSSHVVSLRKLPPSSLNSLQTTSDKRVKKVR